MSAARHAYGPPGVVSAANEPARVAGTVLPLLLLVVGLAAATIWFVALPALDRPQGPERSCEVFVLQSGTTRCVPTPTSGARRDTAGKASKSAG